MESLVGDIPAGDGNVANIFLQCRGGNFRPKINSAEDGIDETNSLFRQISGRSVEHKTLGIPFRNITR
jgi:hypothetical protein